MSKLHVRREGRADQRAMTHRGLCQKAEGREILGGDEVDVFFANAIGEVEGLGAAGSSC